MPRLSDKRMAELGRQLEDIKAQLLAELERRSIDSIEVDGVKVARRRNRYPNYDLAFLRRRLRGALRDRLLVTRVDGRAWNKAVRDGELPDDVVKQAVTSVGEGAAYLEVTIRG